MKRTARKIFLSIILMALFITSGIIFGFSNLADLTNRVQVDWSNNEYGGKTLTKVTTDDNVVAWTRDYAPELAPTIDDCRPYLYQEAHSDEGVVLEYRMIYKSDRDQNEIINFYRKFYSNGKISDLGLYKSLDAMVKDYSVSVLVEWDEFKCSTVFLTLIKGE